MSCFSKILSALFFVFQITVSLGCHETTIQENSVTDNGDGTFDYEVQVCIGNENTWGFSIDFNGANLISVNTPCVTDPISGETICATVPATSGTADVEFGDYDATGGTVFHQQGDGQVCFTLDFTLDGPAADAYLFGTEYTFGPCDDTGDLTSCFGLLTVAGSATDATSGCSSDGEATATASDGFNPYTYSWDNGATGSTITGLTPGDYTVTVTDTEGCTETATYTVGPNPDYTVVFTSSCGGPNVASFTIDDDMGSSIGSATQITGTNTYFVCGCGASATLTYGTQGGQACTGVSLEVFDASGTSLGTATSDGESFALSCVALPVNLKSFRAEYDSEKRTNIIDWSTYSEKNNDFFLVEYSTDGKNWYQLRKVDGASNSSSANYYQVEDRNINSAITYYRLKQVDFNGDAFDFGIRSIDNNNKRKLIKKLNLLGQEVTDDYKGIIILKYDNNTSEKVYQ